MTVLVPLALFGWIPVVVGLFIFLPPQRAVVAAFVIAWLFLPMAHYEIHGLPDYSKTSATSIGVLLATLLFHSGLLLKLRPHWADVPMALWCLCPLPSALSNDMGWYHGSSVIVHQFIIWGIPYLIGRLYFGELRQLRWLALGIFVGGLIYVPLCLFEVRMGPQLHKIVYSYHQHSMTQVVRFGGFRPMVFMQHGLAVAMWMVTATLIGAWLWASGAVRSLWGVPIGWLLAIQAVTTVLCRSVGPLMLLLAGLMTLYWAKWFRNSVLLLSLVAVVPLYVTVRVSHLWTGRGLVELAAQVVGRERADSLQTRINNEDLLSAKAMQRPVFGWSIQSRARVYDDNGRDISITDGLWLVTLMNYGLVGLVPLATFLLLPGLLLYWKLPGEQWAHPAVAPLAALVVLATLHMIDNLPNGMINPIYTLAAGGAAGILGSWNYRSASRCSLLASSRSQPTIQTMRNALGDSR